MNNPTVVSLDDLLRLRSFAQGGRLATRRKSAAASSGGRESRWRGRGVDFRESRIYQAGDDIRHMDWRVTARSGKPHTKLFQEEREQGLLLAIDLNPGMHFGTRVCFKSVQAARAAAFLAWVASREGDRVGALGFGGGITGEMRPASGGRGVLRTLRAIRDWDAAADRDGSQPLSSSLRRLRHLLRPGMRLVIVSDGFGIDADSWPVIGQLAGRHDISIVLLRDAIELAAPPPGRYAVSSGGERRILDLGAPRLRDQWLHLFGDARLRVRSEASRFGIRVVDLDTRDDLRRALAPLLARSRAAGSA